MTSEFFDSYLLTLDIHRLILILNCPEIYKLEKEKAQMIWDLLAKYYVMK